MWDKLNGLQNRIVIGTVVVLGLMILFPPINIERTMSGLSDGRQNLTLTSTEFDGWGFIGQIDFSIPKPIKKPKDPKNPTLLERFEAARPVDPDDLRVGKRRLDFATLLKQIAVLLAIGGAALFLTRTNLDKAGN